MRITDERDSDKIAAALSKTSEWHPTRVGPGLCRDVLVNDGTSWAAAASRPRVTRPLLERGRCHHCGVRVICILSGRASAICRVYSRAVRTKTTDNTTCSKKTLVVHFVFFLPSNLSWNHAINNPSASQFSKFELCIAWKYFLLYFFKFVLSISCSILFLYVCTVHCLKVCTVHYYCLKW